MDMEKAFDRQRKSFLEGDFDGQTKADAFRAGWEACLLEQRADTALKTARKNKEIVMDDFVSEDTFRPQMTGYYCDGGCKVATNGRWLIKLEAKYPAEHEGRIISPETGEELDTNGIPFPNYGRVIPYDEDMTESGITLDDIRLIRSVTKAKSLSNFEKTSVVVNGEWRINLAVADRLLKAWEAFPDAVLYRSRDSFMKAFKLVGKGMTFVFMPMTLEGCGGYTYRSSTKEIAKAA